MNNNFKITLTFLTLLFIGCSSNDKIDNRKYSEFYTNSDSFYTVNYPSDNPSNEEAEKLGSFLFHTKDLSENSTISCAGCHNPETAFSDHNSVSIGINGRPGIRNVPTLINVFHQKRLHMDGGVPTLEMQVMAPIHNLEEMGFQLTTASERLKKDAKLNEMAQKAYNQDINPYVITRAIAAFERQIRSENSRFDAFLADLDSNILTDQEKLGADLFYSDKGKCSKCHSGPNFSNYDYFNIGLSSNYKDLGRERVSLDSLDRGKFKVPTLRNIELTFPYMHDGSIGSLEEVIAFFNKGGHKHWNKSELIKPLGLSLQEEEALVAFLKTLSDQE